MSFTALAMPPPVTADVLPGLPMFCQPAQLHPSPTSWPRQPSGRRHNLGQLVQLSCLVLLAPWCSSLPWLLPVPCPRLGTAGGDRDAGAPPADGPRAMGRG